ncbi:MAG TPA: zf-HC2 domain-containing protein [Candidatus Limnocylindrales bacterium]|nr:zf-HC2 domain-containing protein [Candidatus Limnocylindrales bacterium]
MTAINCRECRALLPAYLDRELTTAVRSRVAAHLDGCDRCHADYVRQRELAAGLRTDLPGLGRLDPVRAGALWTAVQTDLVAPRRVALPFSQGRMSLAVLLMAAALVLPWLVSTGRLSAQPLPLPPTPVSAGVLATDTPLDAVVGTSRSVVSITPPNAPEYAPTQAPFTPFTPVNP